ncbi:hypothetical protein ACJMK2_038867 [Sinanodonta woodiana]|uniref:Uncharacterized protein n=1 Tax=Sinanodonta woodiana TaxID=1069815 RepID=A0ABD3WA97_SINWO
MAIEVITDKDHKAAITTPRKCLSPLPTLSLTTAPSQTKTTTQKEKYKLSTYTLKQIEATTHHSSQITGPAKDLITKDLIYNPPKKCRAEVKIAHQLISRIQQKYTNSPSIRRLRT